MTETRKFAHCPKCCSLDGHAQFVSCHDYDYSGADLKRTPVWRCRNCDHTMARRVVDKSKLKRDENGLTKAQEREVERLKTATLLSPKFTTGRIIKVEPTDYGPVWVTVSVAYDQDKSAWSDEHWFIQVGIRGRSIVYTGPKWFMDGKSSYSWTHLHRAPRA